MFVWTRQEAPPQEVGQVEERMQELGFTSDPRGVGIFEAMPRNPLDLNAVVILKELPYLQALVGVFRVWSDGMQCLDFDLFQSMMKDLQRVAALVDRRL